MSRTALRRQGCTGKKEMNNKGTKNTGMPPQLNRVKYRGGFQGVGGEQKSVGVQASNTQKWGAVKLEKL